MKILTMMTLTWHFLQKCQCLFSIERMNRNLIFTDGWLLYIFTNYVRVKVYKYHSSWYSLCQRWAFRTIWRDKYIEIRTLKVHIANVHPPYGRKWPTLTLSVPLAPKLQQISALRVKSAISGAIRWYHTSYKYQHIHRKTVTCVFFIFCEFFTGGQK